MQNLGTTSTWCLVWPLEEKFENYPRAITVSSGILDQNYQDIYIFFAILYVFLNLNTLFLNCYMYMRILVTLHSRRYNKTLQMSVEFDKNIQQISTMVTANGIVFFSCSTIFNALMTYHAMSLFGVVVLSEYRQIMFKHIQNSMILINASVNPLIYLITNPSYRRATLGPFRS